MSDIPAGSSNQFQNQVPVPGRRLLRPMPNLNGHTGHKWTIDDTPGGVIIVSGGKPISLYAYNVGYSFNGWRTDRNHAKNVAFSILHNYLKPIWGLEGGILVKEIVTTGAVDYLADGLICGYTKGALTIFESDVQHAVLAHDEHFGITTKTPSEPSWISENVKSPSAGSMLERFLFKNNSEKGVF